MLIGCRVVVLFILMSLVAGVAFAEEKSEETKSAPGSFDNEAFEGKACEGVCAHYVSKALLRSAKDFFDKNHIDTAKRYLNMILKDYRQTAAALEAGRLLKVWKKISRFDAGGRIEFVSTSSLFGVGLGIAIPAAFEASSPVIFGLSIVGFTAVGLVGSLLGSSRWAITPGQASSITIGTVWGTWNAFAISGIAQLGGVIPLRLGIVGGVLGYTAGALIGYFQKPSIDVVTFASSLGLWMGGVTGAISIIMGEQGINLSFEGVLSALLATTNIGLLAGIFLHPVINFSRSRSIFINLGGVVGGALGAGLVLLGSPTSATPYVTAALLGAAAGMGLTIFFTRNMRAAKRTHTSFSLLSYRKGEWSLNMPLPSAAPTRDRNGQMTLGLQIPLASGRW